MNVTYDDRRAAWKIDWAFHRVDAAFRSAELPILPPPLNLLQVVMKSWPGRPRCSPDTLVHCGAGVFIDPRDMDESRQNAVDAVAEKEHGTDDLRVLHSEVAELRRKNASLSTEL